MIEVNDLKKHVEDFLYQTEPARLLSEMDRDYKDNKQWTKEEIATLTARGQAPVTDNRIKQKVEGLKGLLIQRRSDPKGYPRTQAHEEASEATTDALRYVGDNADMDDLELEVFDNVIVEGYGGCIVDTIGRGDSKEVMPTLIPWDRIYFDPYSRRSDFKDAQYMGIVIWMDVDVAKQQFKGKDDAIDAALAESSIDETFEDRPRWNETNGDRKRVRIAQEFFLDDGVWHMCIFSGNSYLVDPEPSKYLDEDGNPENPIELVGAYIDRDNNRFGEVRFWIDMQDEINHRRSKFLFTLSSRQTIGRKGAVPDIDAMKTELSKPNGHVEYEGEKGEFEILPTGDMANGQFSLLEQSMAAMDSSSFNAQLSGERQGDLSGKAVQSLQMAGMLETNSLYNAMNSWKKRVYRQVWYRIKQHWTKEKWIRVTDDYNKLRWVGFNIDITRQQQMEEFINDDSHPEQERKEAARIFVQLQQNQDPRLQEVVKTQNPIAELDMDIILEQSVSSLNVQQEQFAILSKLAENRPEVPFTALLRMSELRDKEDLIQEIQQGQEQAQQIAQQNAELETQDKTLSLQGKQIDNKKKSADIDKTAADTTNTNMKSITAQLENENLMRFPDPSPQVNL
jgi:hypothetical protein